jgi:hypothetical protein
MFVSKERAERLVQKIKEMAPSYAEHIAPVYQQLDWKWAFGSVGAKRVPTATEIEENICKLADGILRVSAENKPEIGHISYGSGGLQVYFELEAYTLSYGIRFTYEKEECEDLL